MQDFLAKGSPLHFGLGIGETYDDNIFISPEKTSDFITNISPDVDFEKGDRTAINSNYLNLYFAPTLFLYAEHGKQDRENYNADVFYQYQFTRLTLGLEQKYQHLTDADIDIGDLATRNIYTTALSGNYIYNGKLIFYGTATQEITDYETRADVDTNQWTVNAYGLYQVAPKLSLGAGPRIAFIDIIGAPNETHEDLLAHLSYNPEGKITVTFAGGMEYLQYQNDTPSRLLPIFDFSGNYTPFDGTIISLSASRESIISYDFDGENILQTSVQASVKQRFMEDAYLTISAGYTIADYETGSVDLTGPERKDNYFFASVGLEWDPQRWLKFDTSYQRSQDDSSFSQNTFNDNQINVGASVHF